MPTTAAPTDLANLVEEYRDLVQHVFLAGDDPTPLDEQAWLAVQGALVANHAWLHDGAAELVGLVEAYGAFILRNAAALAIAIGIEDGSKGL